MTDGTIKTASIQAARETMLTIITRFMEVEKSVALTRQNLCEDWVGDGRNEFQTQYNLLVSKVSDIGESLKEMYEALIEAEAAYADADDKYHQQVTMALQDAGLDTGDLNTHAILSGQRAEVERQRETQRGAK